MVRTDISLEYLVVIKKREVMKIRDLKKEFNLDDETVNELYVQQWKQLPSVVNFMPGQGVYEFARAYEMKSDMAYSMLKHELEMKRSG